MIARQFVRQFERRQRRTTGLRLHQMRIEQVVQLMIPGDDRARHPAEKQEGGDGQPRITMKICEGPRASPPPYSA